jgi:Domain of unknown function (DUF4352)
VHDISRPLGLIVALGWFGCQGNGSSRFERAPASAGAATAATPDSPTNVGQTGARIRTTHYVMQVSTPDDCSPAARGLAGSQRLGVQVEIEPTGEVQVPANPYYARLIDGLGNVYEATLGGCGGPLAPTLPERGQIARGWVVFEVPRSARDFTLTYAPELVGALETEVSVALGR